MTPSHLSFLPSMEDEVSPVLLGVETFILKCFHLVGITILYWDHIITFDREIGYLWMRRKTISSLWFFLIRYIGFVGNVPVVVFSFLSFPESKCRTYYIIHQTFLVLTQFVISVVLIIRTYALYGQDKRILAVLLTGGACLIAALSWAAHGQHAIPDSLFSGCNLGISLHSGYHLSVSWIAGFLFDTLILSLTVRRICTMRRDLGLGGGLMPLHMLIARDSALYYAAMALANLANIMTYYTTGPLLRGSLATFSNCVSVSIMSRIMLNLHEEATTGILSEFTVNSASLAIMSMSTSTSEYRQSTLSNIPPIRRVSELRTPQFNDEGNLERIEEVLREGVV